MTFPRDERRILPMVTPKGSSTESLTALVASIRDAVLEDRRSRGLPGCCVTLDVSDDHAAGISPSLLREVLEPLLARAIADSAPTSDDRAARGDSPALHEVVVTSIASDDTFEIEVADSGRGLAARKRGVTEHSIQSLLEQVGGTLIATNCPEGGAAFTVRLPHRRQKRMAA